MMIANRRRIGNRRRAERRQQNLPVLIERRQGQDRRRPGERRQQDLYVLSSDYANRLCSELEKVPADNPISRLLVVQKFLLDHRSRREGAWMEDARIMEWARELRDVYYGGDRKGMWSAVFRALYGDRASQTLS
jgi:hypothetical protein